MTLTKLIRYGLVWAVVILAFLGMVSAISGVLWGSEADAWKAFYLASIVLTLMFLMHLDVFDRFLLRKLRVSRKEMVIICLAVILVAVAAWNTWEGMQGPSGTFRQRGAALRERFVVERVNFDRENEGIILYVRNVGAEEVSIAAIYINGTAYSGNAMNPQSPCVFSTHPLGQVVTMGVGSLCQFNLTWPTAWDGGSIFYIVVATARGNQAAITSRAP